MALPVSEYIQTRLTWLPMMLILIFRLTAGHCVTSVPERDVQPGFFSANDTAIPAPTWMPPALKAGRIFLPMGNDGDDDDYPSYPRWMPGEIDLIVIEKKEDLLAATLNDIAQQLHPHSTTEDILEMAEQLDILEQQLNFIRLYQQVKKEKRQLPGLSTRLNTEQFHHHPGHEEPVDSSGVSGELIQTPLYRSGNCPQPFRGNTATGSTSASSGNPSPRRRRLFR